MDRMKGFTLLELMITLVIAGIIIAIAVPSFQNLIIDSRLNSTTSELADAVRLARSEALKRNRPVIFCQIDPATPGTCVSSGAWKGWAMHDSQDDEPVLRVGTLDNFGSTIRVSSDISGQSAAFSGDGLIRSAGSLITDRTITVCATSGTGDKTRKVVFGAAGRVSVTSVAGGCP